MEWAASRICSVRVCFCVAFFFSISECLSLLLSSVECFKWRSSNSKAGMLKKQYRSQNYVFLREIAINHFRFRFQFSIFENFPSNWKIRNSVLKWINQKWPNNVPRLDISSKFPRDSENRCPQKRPKVSSDCDFPNASGQIGTFMFK